MKKVIELFFLFFLTMIPFYSESLDINSINHDRKLNLNNIIKLKSDSSFFRLKNFSFEIGFNTTYLFSNKYTPDSFLANQSGTTYLFKFHATPSLRYSLAAHFFIPVVQNKLFFDISLGIQKRNYLYKRNSESSSIPSLSKVEKSIFSYNYFEIPLGFKYQLRPKYYLAGGVALLLFQSGIYYYEYGDKQKVINQKFKINYFKFYDYYFRLNYDFVFNKIIISPNIGLDYTNINKEFFLKCCLFFTLKNQKR